MADTTFMRNKFSIDTLVSHYLEEIKKLKSFAKTPLDETKRQTYFQAVSAFKNVSVKDIVQFAMSYGRNATGKQAQMKNALPIMLGYRVTQYTPIDIAYAQLLLEYTKAFKANRSNIKEWSLRFVINSRFSPLHTFIEQELDRLIKQTEQTTKMSQSRF